MALQRYVPGVNTTHSSPCSYPHGKPAESQWDIMRSNPIGSIGALDGGVPMSRVDFNNNVTLSKK